MNQQQLTAYPSENTSAASRGRIPDEFRVRPHAREQRDEDAITHTPAFHMSTTVFTSATRKPTLASFSSVELQHDGHRRTDVTVGTDNRRRCIDKKRHHKHGPQRVGVLVCKALPRWAPRRCACKTNLGVVQVLRRCRCSHHRL